MPKNNQTAFSTLFASMADIFRKANPDDLEDLRDALDVTVDPAKDNWNTGDRGNRIHNEKMGPEASMSAPDGLEAMIREYSELAMQTGLSQAYDKFSEEMKSRMSSLEKAVGAIATLLAKTAGEPFENDGAEKGDESAELEEDDSASSKAVAPVVRSVVGGVPGLMARLQGASHDTGKLSLKAPPNMSVMAKARQSGVQQLQQYLDSNVVAGDTRNALSSFLNAAKHYEQDPSNPVYANQMRVVISKCTPDASALIGRFKISTAAAP